MTVPPNDRVSIDDAQTLPAPMQHPMQRPLGLHQCGGVAGLDAEASLGHPGGFDCQFAWSWLVFVVSANPRVYGVTVRSNMGYAKTRYATSVRVTTYSIETNKMIAKNKAIKPKIAKANPGNNA